MKLLQCSPCCNSHNHHHHHHQQESSSQPHHLNSESSSHSSSLSSQPSLPSVPSLTPQQSHNNHPEPPQLTAHHEFITAIKGHTSPIFSLALHGKSLYSGSSNSEIRTCKKDPFALQPPNNKNTTTLVAISNGAVKSMIVSNDGNKLFTAHQDHKIRVWRVIEEEPKKSDQIEKQRNCYYKCIATLPTFQDRFTKLFSSKNYVEVRRHKKCTWVHHVDTVSALALSYDGALLYSVSWDRTFKIWRTSDFKCLESVNAHEDAINAIALSREGIVYTGSADKKIKVWKKFEGEKKHRFLGTLEKHKSAVNALALSEDGSVLYSGACDRSILVWEKKEREEEGNDDGVMVLVGALRGHTKAILCLVVVSDLVFSGSADNSVRIWRRYDDDERKRCYSCLAVLEGHRRPVKCLAVAVDSNGGGGGGGGGDGGGGGGDGNRSSSYVVYSGSLDCDIRVWKMGNAK